MPSGAANSGFVVHCPRRKSSPTCAADMGRRKCAAAFPVDDGVPRTIQPYTHAYTFACKEYFRGGIIYGPTITCTLH
jgi:hypothetical protein